MCWTCGGAPPKDRDLRNARWRLGDSIARKEVRMDKRIYCTRHVDRVRREENVDGSFWVDQTCIDWYGFRSCICKTLLLDIDVYT